MGREVGRSHFLDVRVGLHKHQSPPLDFTDEFYTKNGIDVVKLGTISPLSHPDGRVGMDGRQFTAEFGSNPADWNGKVNLVLDNSNSDPTRKGVRVTQTTSGFDKDGNLIYYNIYGTVPDDTFLPLIPAEL